MARAKIQRIVVNKHKVKANIANGTDEAVISIQRSGETPEYGHEVDVVVGGVVVGTFVYRPGKPLACGATVWFETRAELRTRSSRVRIVRGTACPI